MSDLKKYARWSEWEAGVLAKVSDPEKCQKVILRRQRDVDDDQDESDLVAAEIRSRLRSYGQNPETCCVFVPTSALCEWINGLAGESLHQTKVTPYLRRLAIAELERAPRTAKAAGWVWRGPKSTKRQKPIDITSLRYLPRPSE